MKTFQAKKEITKMLNGRELKKELHDNVITKIKSICDESNSYGNYKTFLNLGKLYL